MFTFLALIQFQGLQTKLGSQLAVRENANQRVMHRITLAKLRSAPSFNVISVTHFVSSMLREASPLADFGPMSTGGNNN